MICPRCKFEIGIDDEFDWLCPNCNYEISNDDLADAGYFEDKDDEIDEDEFDEEPEDELS